MSDSTSESSSGSQPVPQAGFSLVRLAVTLLVVVGVGGGGFAWYLFGGGEKLLGGLFTPAIVEGHGTLMWNGEAVPGATISTSSDHSGLRGSIALVQDDGTFKFMTDVDGNYIDGLYVGEQRLTVKAYALQIGPSSPQLLTPEKYTSFSTSGLVIQVDSDPAKNVFNLVLEGPAPPAPERRGPPGGGGGGPGNGDASDGNDPPEGEESSADRSARPDAEDESNPEENAVDAVNSPDFSSDSKPDSDAANDDSSDE